jgi:hypothetical protein
MCEHWPNSRKKSQRLRTSKRYVKLKPWSSEGPEQEEKRL